MERGNHKRKVEVQSPIPVHSQGCFAQEKCVCNDPVRMGLSPKQTNFLARIYGGIEYRMYCIHTSYTQRLESCRKNKHGNKKTDLLA